MGALLLPEVEKLQPRNNSNLCPCDIRWVIAIGNYWPRILYFQISTLEGPKFMISHALIQIFYEEYINRGLYEELQNLLQIWMPKSVYSLYLTLDNIKNVFFQIS